MTKSQYIAIASVLSAALGALVQQQLLSPEITAVVAVVVSMLHAVTTPPGSRAHPDDLPGSGS